MKINIVPDSLIEMTAKIVGKNMLYCLPLYIKSLMDEIKDAIEEAVSETKEFASEHGKHALSISGIPFYGFSEGHYMITEMEEICNSHFNQMLNSKICSVATKSKPDLRIAKKTAMGFIESKEFKRAKKLFHQQTKKHDGAEGSPPRFTKFTKSLGNILKIL